MKFSAHYYAFMQCVLVARSIMSVIIICKPAGNQWVLQLLNIYY